MSRSSPHSEAPAAPVRPPGHEHPVQFTTGERESVQECMCEERQMGEAASPLCGGGSSDDAVVPLLPLLPLLAHFLSLSHTKWFLLPS